VASAKEVQLTQRIRHRRGRLRDKIMPDRRGSCVGDVGKVDGCRDVFNELEAKPPLNHVALVTSWLTSTTNAW
jgi:hypothetical protein